MATEKSQQNLFAGIESFDAKNLKHAETQEKNPLPDKDGKCQFNILKQKQKTKHKYIAQRHLILKHSSKWSKY